MHVLRRALLLTSLLSGLSASCRDDRPQDYAAPPSGESADQLDIHLPEKLTSIETEQVDGLGRPVRIACATCHSLKETASMPASTDELEEFHRGMTFEHGTMRCANCHAPDAAGAPELHLADGTRMPMHDALSLCAQCHGPQYRDYQHGAHGGMRGAWDPARERNRNHCVDCHDPHAPKIPKVTPAPPVVDRNPVSSRKSDGPHG